MAKAANEIVALGNGPAEVVVEPGATVVVTGPNGVGKSAFLQYVPSSGPVERFYGSRHISFTSDETSEVGQSLKGLLDNLRGSNRYHHHYGEQHLKSVIRRILERQFQTTNDIVLAQERGTAFATAKVEHPRPIDQINSVFEAARLPVNVVMDNGTLKATRDGASFSLDRMSDGERAALLLVGAIVIQPSGGFLVVDEPERHLNPSISGPLIATAVRLRNDVGFLFATHDLALIEWLRPDKTIHIHNSIPSAPEHDGRLFDYAVLDEADGIPESLRYALLGSRRALLLVEGTSTSEDRALYSLVYRGWNVLPREGWPSVISGVTALSENEAYHWLRVAGLVDGDGRSEDEKATLASKQVYTLPSPTIENVFLYKEIVLEMANAAYELFGGETVDQRMTKVEAEVRKAFENGKIDIVARRATWAANRALEASKVAFSEVKGGLRVIPEINVECIMKHTEAEFNDALEKSTVFEALAVMPIKNTNIPSLISKAIGYDNSKKYFRSVLKQIEIGSVRGSIILDVLKAHLPELPSLDEI